jgi:hypothetical protein
LFLHKVSSVQPRHIKEHVQVPPCAHTHLEHMPATCAAWLKDVRVAPLVRDRVEVGCGPSIGSCSRLNSCHDADTDCEQQYQYVHGISLLPYLPFPPPPPPPSPLPFLSAEFQGADEESELVAALHEEAAAEAELEDTKAHVSPRGPSASSNAPSELMEACVCVCVCVCQWLSQAHAQF